MTEDRRLLIEIPFGFSGKIFRSPMPFSNFDYLDQVWDLYRQNDVQVVVVLTEKQEYLVHARRDLPNFYRSNGLGVIHFPIQDYHVPTDRIALENTISDVGRLAGSGKNIVVHCMAGRGRTGIFMACLAKTYLKLDGRASSDWVRQHIPGALENEFQEQFVLDY